MTTPLPPPTVLYVQLDDDRELEVAFRTRRRIDSFNVETVPTDITEFLSAIPKFANPFGPAVRLRSHFDE